MRWLALVCVAAACGGGDDAAPDAGDPDAESCAPSAGGEVYFDPADPCRHLSSYRLFAELPGQVPNARVIPYDLNSPLFSDYTTKLRFVWVPPGAAIGYDADGALDIPVGSVLVKTFAYLDDLREPDGGRRLLETRLLVHGADGWRGLTYVWNDDQTDARLRVAGGALDVSWVHSDGQTRESTYIVPDVNQCKECHEETESVLAPLGPKARHLNRELDYGDGPVNQLVHLAELGVLVGAPGDPADIPRAPVWDDPTTGTVDERARAYLEINCASCHNPGGRARTSGLDLMAAQTDPFKFGVCKAPVAAGGGSGGRQYSIVPGAPDESILVYRMESTDPDVRMPEILRTQVHEEGVALIREWVAAMPGGCDP